MSQYLPKRKITGGHWSSKLKKIKKLDNELSLNLMREASKWHTGCLSGQESEHLPSFSTDVCKTRFLSKSKAHCLIVYSSIYLLTQI